MVQTVGVWGNNLAIRIPKTVPFIEKGQKVELTVKDNVIQISPLKKRRSMAELLQSAEGAEHPALLVDFGPDVGEEVLP